MKKPVVSSPRDFLALLVRRKWWIIVPFMALSLAVAVLTYLMPRMYVSESLIVIQPRGVPEDFVKDLIAGTAEQRLSAIEKTVLSRTNLEQLVEQFGARVPEFRPLNIDEKVRKLRTRIGVTFEAERRMGVAVPLSYFRIFHQNPDPELAQAIASKVTSLFIEQDRRAREYKVSGTVEFFSREVEKVGEQLSQSESKLRQLREARRYELPDQLETNLRTLDRLNLQKQANAEALDRSATLRLNLERLISETPALIPGEAAGSRGTPSKASANPLVELYRKKEIEYRQLTDKYKEKHPDVESAKAELERLKKEIPPEDFIRAEQPASAGAPPVMTPNPVYQNLTSEMRKLKTEIDIREREKIWIESEIAKYSEWVRN